MAETADRTQGINFGLVITIGLVGVIVLFGIIIPGIQALIYSVEGRFTEQTVVSQRNVSLRDHELEQLSRINSYRWVNQSEGIAAIPIERAMRRYAERGRLPGPLESDNDE
jgi:hypothetical protein